MKKNDKFDKQMQQKWARDLQDVNLDSQSQAQDNNYFQIQRMRLQKQLQALNNKNTNKNNKNLILQTLMNNNAIQSTLIQDFQTGAADLKAITRQQKNQPLNQETLKAIKNKVAAQSSNLSFVLTDQHINKLQQQKKKEKLKNSNLNNSEDQMNMTASNFMKNKKNVQEMNILNVKLEKAAIERQLLMMGRQDQFSMKYQIYCQSMFFSERFCDPQLKIYKQKDFKIDTTVNPPKSTFTNLRPMPNKEYNVLPKNAPEIALKKMKRAKKLSLIPDTRKTIPLKISKISSSYQEQIQKQNKNGLNIDITIQQKTKNNELDSLLKAYITKIRPIFQFIHKTMKNYNPKFIKKFLQLEQKASNIDLSDLSQAKQKSLQGFLVQDEYSLSKLKDLTVTFESLTSLKGVQNYKNIESVALQYNLLKNINLLGKCNKLIEINISYNKLNQINEGVKELPWLKYLNAQHNQIKDIDFSLSHSLQIAILNNNHIQVIKNAGKNIKIMNLCQNNLSQLNGFQNSHLLQQLNLNKNYLNSLKGLQRCILLRKLEASNNRLGNSQDFKNISLVYLFLNELIINHNYINQLPLCFLPSLEKLYLQNNKLKQVPLKMNNQNDKIIYLPNLKVLNLDNNNLQGFSYVWYLLRFSQNLQILKYDNNECFLNLRDQARALYQSIIYKNMKGIKILNQNPAQIGLKKFYQSAYKVYLDNFSMFSQKSQMLQNLEKKIDFVLKQQRIISEIDKSQIKFSQTNIFVKYKSIQLANNLFQIANFINPQQEKIQIKQNKNITQQSSKYPLFLVNNSIFYQHDKYQLKIRSALHKIRSLVVKYQYRKNKRKKYYQKNANSIWKSFQRIHLLKQKLLLKFGFDSIYQSTMRFNKQQAAIYIQKIWRGYRMRKRYLKIMKQLKSKSNDYDDLQDLPQFDQREFDQYADSHQFNFDIPQHLNFQDYIIKPQVFTLLEQQNKKSDQKFKQYQKRQQSQNVQNNPLINNFFSNQNNNNSIVVNNQSSYSNHKKKQQEQDERLMKQWGFKDKASLQGFKLKRRRKEEMKRKQKQKNMTAQQRLQRFKKNH